MAYPLKMRVRYTYHYTWDSRTPLHTDIHSFAQQQFYFKIILNKLDVVYELFFIRRYGLCLLH